MRGPLTILLLLFTTLLLTAQRESIESFDSVMEVGEDGSVEVTETIVVKTDEDIIRRGITRAITRKPIGGGDRQLDYEVVSVMRDGEAIDWFDERTGSLHTFYLGSKDKRLPAGRYLYQFIYRSDDQVYRAQGIEEVRWHLVDTDTKLAVERASMTIVFPPNLPIAQAACLAGSEGSRERHCAQQIDSNAVTFTLARRLDPGEGMTVAAGVAPGSFDHLAAAQPTPGINQLSGTPPAPEPTNQKSLYAILIGLMIALVYGHQSWLRYGRDPKVRGEKYQFAPPEGLSPAGVAYLHSGLYAQQAVTGSLTDLIVRGYVELSERTSKGFLGLGKQEYFVLSATDKVPTPAVSPEEQLKLYEGLFARGRTVELDGTYNKHLAKATKAHQTSLAKQHKSFKRDGANLTFVWPMIGIVLLTLLAGIITFRQADQLGKIAVTAFVPLAIFGIFLYAWLIRRPSQQKVGLLQRIDAFRSYLKLNKGERDELRGAPDMTQEYYDRILPYAIGLGLENAWAEDLQHDWLGSSTRRDRTGNYPLLYGADFSTRLHTSFAGTSTHASSGGGGSVGGGGGGTGGF